MRWRRIVHTFLVRCSYYLGSLVDLHFVERGLRIVIFIGVLFDKSLLVLVVLFRANADPVCSDNQEKDEISDHDGSRHVI